MQEKPTVCIGIVRRASICDGGKGGPGRPGGKHECALVLSPPHPTVGNVVRIVRGPAPTLVLVFLFRVYKVALADDDSNTNPNPDQVSAL
ncbi:unnamed protein product [Soboliphyme baturini]|uniref:Uncharacterized protein n=1 Tax=Soboliphyme baturini TaxID=241478 RepID=A0A183ICB3_9BILA|nr:unnamed protein product [Soboliphyme baturini]